MKRKLYLDKNLACNVWKNSLNFFLTYLTLILKASFKFPSIIKRNELDICDPATLYKPNINYMHLWIKKLREHREQCMIRSIFISHRKISILTEYRIEIHPPYTKSSLQNWSKSFSWTSSFLIFQRFTFSRPWMALVTINLQQPW